MNDTRRNASVTTSQLLQPQRLEGETYEEYVKRRRDMNKVIRAHIRGQSLPTADLFRPGHSYYVPRA